MTIGQIALVVHPRRDIDDALGSIREWAARQGIAVGQVEIPSHDRRVADPVDAASADLLIAVGGDGTTLAALHAGAAVSRPVLGVACGSIGVLTSVTADRLTHALELVAEGEWSPRSLPGLELKADSERLGVAINDVVAVREGGGQLMVTITLDGELYARTSGDGVIVATQVGSSAYSMAAGGPILAADATGMVVTPLAQHGGSVPPLVVAPDSRVGLVVDAGFAGSRVEMDGRRLGSSPTEMSLALHPGYATLMSLADQEPMLTGLRRRGLVTDAPRVLVRDARR